MYSNFLSVDLTIISKEFNFVFFNNCSKFNVFKGIIILFLILDISLLIRVIGILDIVLYFSIIVGASILLLYLKDKIK